MKTLKFMLFLGFCSVTAMAWAVPFSDDFNRPDSDDIGNGWETQLDGTIKATIKDQEILIQGQQGTDWARSGITRPVEDETKIFFDFLANDNFNIHIRIDDTDTTAYIELYAPPSGSFSYANSKDGGWPGWTSIGTGMIAGLYNNLGIEQDGSNFSFILNGKEMTSVKNPNLEKITTVLISVDSAAGTVGSAHVDNVVIGEPSTQSQPVEPAGKLPLTWAELKTSR